MTMLSPTARSACLGRRPRRLGAQAGALGEVDPEHEARRTARPPGSRRSRPRRAATPVHWVEAGIPASLSRLPGTAYFTTVPERPGTRRPPRRPAQAVAPPVTPAQTRTARRGSGSPPGRIGTMMPSRPTRIARPTTDFGEGHGGNPPTGAETGPEMTAAPDRGGPGPSLRGLWVRSPSRRDRRACRRACGSRPRRSTAISRSLSPCSRAWWAQKRSSPPDWSSTRR